METSSLNVSNSLEIKVFVLNTNVYCGWLVGTKEALELLVSDFKTGGWVDT